MSVLLGVAVISLAACADVLGIGEGGRRAATSGAGGGAGRSGSAGRHGGRAGNAGNSGGTTAGGGGASGGASGGPAGEGGDSPGPRGGSSPARGGSGGDGASAAAGASAAGGKAPTIPGTEQLGADCPEEDALACSDANPFLVLWCRDGVWAVQTTCTLDARCDPSTHECLGVETLCRDLGALGPVCHGSSVLDCSPELYAGVHLECPFGCRDGACDPGSATELTLHTGVLPPTGIAWQGSVPVCVATEDAGDELDWVRDEIERVFNRFISVEFVGWGACEADPNGVVLSFADDCRGWLVNDFAPGKPKGGEPLPVTICRSYYDNAGVYHPLVEDESVESLENLIRLLARHQFAHVIAFLDGTDARETVMVRGVERESESHITLTSTDYRWLSTVLGKGPDRISTPKGECLTAVSSDLGASVVASTCSSASTRQGWTPVNDRIHAADPSTCWQNPATSGGDVVVANCELTGDEQRFRLAHAQWRTSTRCVTPEHLPAMEGTFLVTEPCDEVGAASQAWFFEVRGMGDPGNYRMQIHFGDSGLCVVAPFDAEWLDPVALGPCVDTPGPNDPQLVLMSPDGIGGNSLDELQNVRCLNWQEPDGRLKHGQCGEYSHYFASGALEGANGMALSLSDSGTLSTAPLGATPEPNQVFDVSF